MSPGPWLYDCGEVLAANGVDVIARADRERGCKIPPVERDANMRLCALAPELLEALESLEEQARQVVHGERSHIDAHLWTAAQRLVLRAREQ